jgi:hypothetical protein
MTKKLLTLLPLSLMAGAVGLQGQVLFSQANDSLFVINDGTFTQATGAFARAAEADIKQGVLASFDTYTLNNVGQSITATFTWLGGGSNNSAQHLTFGFFNGGAITGDAQTATSDGWEGYFHALPTRTSSGNVVYGVHRQGEGTQPLFDRETTGFSINGASVTPGNPRPPLNQDVATQVTLTLTRLAGDQVQLSTVYRSPSTGHLGSASGSSGGIAWTSNVVLDPTDSNFALATITSTTAVADGPVAINGIALAGQRDFTLTDLQVIPEPSTYAALFGLLALGCVAWRRRRAR